MCVMRRACKIRNTPGVAEHQIPLACRAPRAQGQSGCNLMLLPHLPTPHTRAHHCCSGESRYMACFRHVERARAEEDPRPGFIDARDGNNSARMISRFPTPKSKPAVLQRVDHVRWPVRTRAGTSRLLRKMCVAYSGYPGRSSYPYLVPVPVHVPQAQA